MVEYNGDVYPCDFFVTRELKLGSIFTDTWEQLRQSPVYAEFGARKAALARACGNCPYLALCNGDCPRLHAAANDFPAAPGVLCFERDGLTGLTEEERPGRPRRLGEKQLQAIDRALRGSPEDFGLSGNLRDGKTLSAYVKSQWDVTLGTRQCQRLFRQLGFRLRKPRSLIAHADPDKQARVKKLRRLARSEGVDLWAMDEVDFQQHGTRCRMWIPPESADPVLLYHPTRRSVGYFGAVRLRDGKLVYRRETDRFNAETCFAFLRQLWAVSSRSGRRVVVIADNARYHHAALHNGVPPAGLPKVAFCDFSPPPRPTLGTEAPR